MDNEQPTVTVNGAKREREPELALVQSATSPNLAGALALANAPNAALQLALGSRPSQQLRFFQTLAAKRCDDFTKAIHQLAAVHAPAVHTVVDEVNSLLTDAELSSLRRFVLRLVAARSRSRADPQCNDGALANNNNAEDETNREEVLRQRDELLLEVSVLREQIDAQAERLKELEAARSASDKNPVSQAQPHDASLLIRSLEEENGRLRAQLAYAVRLAGANANINDDAPLLAQNACEANGEQQQQQLASARPGDFANASARSFAYSAIKRSQTMMTASPRTNADAALYEAIAQRLLLDSANNGPPLISATSSSSLPAAYLHRASTSTSARQAPAQFHHAGRIGYQVDERGSQSSVQTTPPAAGSVQLPPYLASPSTTHTAFRRNTPFRATVTGVTRLATDQSNGTSLPLPLPDPLGGLHSLSALQGGPFSKPLVVQLVGMAPREARRIMMGWLPDTLHALLREIGLDEYVDRCRHSIKTVAHFIDAVDRRSVHRLLGIKNYFHRKKLYFWMAALLVDAVRSSRQLASVLHTLLVDWDHELVARWLDDAGLPEYKDSFRSNRVDGLLLEVLTVDEAVNHLRITNELHHISLKRAVQVLRLIAYRYDRLIRRAADVPKQDSAPGTLERASVGSGADGALATDEPPRPQRPGTPGDVLLWTNARVAQWLSSIDLAEFASHLRGSGVHGALMVLEPRFTAELLADVLAIPPSRTLLRRHLKTQFVELLGAKVQARKREFAESSTSNGQRRTHPAPDTQPLTLTSRVKSPTAKRSSLLLFSFRRRADKAQERRALSKLVDSTAESNGGTERPAPSAARTDPAYNYLCPFNDAALKDVSAELCLAFHRPESDDTDWRPLSSAHQNGDDSLVLSDISPQPHNRRTRSSNSNSLTLSTNVGAGVMRSSVNEADEDEEPDAFASSGSSIHAAINDPNLAVVNPLKIALNDAALLPKMPASNV